MRLKIFNKRIALWVTEKVGTMWCAYAFCSLALISLPEALASQDPLEDRLLGGTYFSPTCTSANHH